ncbi:hypothetical protein HDV03_000540 [Kappamyces sp. JEL0829]|nr:hypothetical protein HDV03_000540 [Kappamyces sp. JEL0829]
MLSSLEQELAELDFSQSTYFSATRHQSRVADAAADITTKKAVPGDAKPHELLQFESIVSVKSDAILDEAKSLLRDWMSDDRVTPNLQDEYDCFDRWMETSKKNEPSSSSVRRLILDAIPSADERRVGSQNLGVSLKVRQDMAREKRALMQRQRELRQLEDEARQKRIRQQVVTHHASLTQKSAKAKAVQQEVAVSIAKEELEAARQEIEQDHTVLAKQAVIELKKETLAEEQEKLQLLKDKQREQEKSLAMQQTLLKVEQLKRAKDAQWKRTVVSAWVALVRQQNLRVKKLNLAIGWKTLNTHWSRWKTAVTARRERREMDLAAAELKEEHQKTIKAVRHDRLQKLSSAMLLWREWIELTRQNKLIRLAHERRALKMAQFLRQLEERQEAALLKETLPEPEREPEPVKHPSGPAPAARACPAKPAPSCVSAKRPPSAVKPFKPSKRDQELVEAMNRRERDRAERKSQLQREREERQLEKEAQQDDLERQERDRIVEERKRLERETLRLMEEREAEKHAMQAKLQRAKEHYTRSLLALYGLRPLRLHLWQEKERAQAAVQFSNKLVQRAAFQKLGATVRAKRLAMEDLASAQAAKWLLRLAWTRLLAGQTQRRQQERLADYVFMARVGKEALGRWKGRFKAVSLVRWEEQRQKNAIADQFAHRAIPRRYLGYWKQFVSGQKEERWKEYRRNRLREAAREALSQSSILQQARVAGDLDLALDAEFLVLD